MSRESARSPVAGAPAAAAPLLRLKGVSKRFTRPINLAQRAANLFGAENRVEVVRAVEGVDLSVSRGSVVGLVGESGCGKSTLGRVVAGLHAASEGTVEWEGRELAALPAATRARAKLGAQMIFQDPMSSLNPRMRVEGIVGEAPVVHGLWPGNERAARVDALLARVGLDGSYRRRYPHQMSGGQRARVGIARALAVEPRFLVCDESVAALDVSIQAQVINLFMDLRRDLGLTYLFVSHDLGVVRHLADRVAVMYLGRVVEEAPAAELFARPNHPYTRALLANVPTLAQRGKRFEVVQGEIPSPLAPPSGCHFHPRCPHAHHRCRVEAPALKPVAAGHRSACHLNDEGVPLGERVGGGEAAGLAGDGGLAGAAAA